MKQFIAILVFTVCLATSAKAQTFLNDLQKSKPGEGKITVTQSADIDNLVNNAKLKYAQEQASKQKAGQNVVPQDDKDKKNKTHVPADKKDHHTAATEKKENHTALPTRILQESITVETPRSTRTLLPKQTTHTEARTASLLTASSL